MKPRITVGVLEDMGACDTEDFEETFPRGARITLRNLRKADREISFRGWFVAEILKPRALEQFFSMFSACYAPRVCDGCNYGKPFYGTYSLGAECEAWPHILWKAIKAGGIRKRYQKYVGR